MIEFYCDKFYVVTFLFSFRNVIYQFMPSEWCQLDFISLDWQGVESSCLCLHSKWSGTCKMESLIASHSLKATVLHNRK